MTLMKDVDMWIVFKIKFIVFREEQNEKYCRISSSVKNLMKKEVEEKKAIENHVDADGSDASSYDDNVPIHVIKRFDEIESNALFFVHNLPQFAPVHYPFTVPGYPDHLMSRCPCSRFYKRFHNSIFSTKGKRVFHKI